MHTKAAQMVDHVFGHMQASYIRLLSGVMQARSAIVIMVVAVIINIVVFYGLTAKELAPQEDEGFLGVIATAPNGATLDYLKAYNESIGRVFNQFPQVASTMIIDGHPSANQILAGMVLKDWSDRKQTQMQLKTPLQLKLNDIPGMKAFAFQPASLPGSGGSFPINFVLNTTMDMQQLFAAMETLKELAMRSGLFMFLQPDLHFDTPQLSIEIDRKKAADLGITTQDVASALSIMVGDQRANRFTVLGYSYEVVPQVDPQFRANSHELGNIYLGTNTGQLIPMSSVVKYRGHNQPDVLNQFQQLNSVTLSGVPMPGVSLGYALNYLATTAQAALPKAIGVGYTGQSRQYMQEGNTLLLAFAFSVIIIFLLLSAQFESFRDPFIILLTVPMCLFGALTPLFLGLATINIYTQIGMITLVGLISKHGILIVSCANDLRLQGKTKSEAILAAAEQRLRPVLMTTGAMVFGVVPLLFASGAGAVSRFDLGLVITSGMLVGTCFTLLVVPVFYSLFSYRDANLNSI